jgi:hypothetical protein
MRKAAASRSVTAFADRVPDAIPLAAGPTSPIAERTATSVDEGEDRRGLSAEAPAVD